MLFSIARASLYSRRKTAILTFLSLTISMLVLFSVEHVRLQAKDSFNRTISGTDLIVGAPSGQLNLLLYSVFRIGTPTNNIQYDSYTLLERNEFVDWTIPISLGDTHKGFRVLGTNHAYFKHYQFGKNANLSFAEGDRFESLFETVIGADVASQLGYNIGDKIVIAHGLGSTSFTMHDQAPFVISGILERTGTPVDKTVHLSLEAIEAIHLPASSLAQVVEDENALSLTPSSITAVLVGLKSKLATFRLQRDINNYPNDRLMAVLPGVALTELWSLVSVIENVLRIIAVLVLVSSLFGLSTMLLASMNERKSEIAVLRVLGAGPAKIVLLIILEALLIALSALAMACLLLTLILLSSEKWLASEFGLFLSVNILSPEVGLMAIGVIVATIITAFFPCVAAYKNALHQKLSAKS